jgi:hypothetical protein
MSLSLAMAGIIICVILTQTVNQTYAFTNGGSIYGYPDGMGYIMTYDVATFIATSAPYLHKGWPEDAVCGMWIAATNFKFHPDRRFHAWDWKVCSNESIIIHKHKYEALDEDGVMRSCFP